MKNLTIGVFLIPLVLSMAATEAAQESEERTFQPLSSRAVYLGPVPNERELGQRAVGQEAASGAIEVYNVWTSFQEPEIKANLSLNGHAYQICSDQHTSFFFASLIFNSANSIDVKVTYNLSRAQKQSTTCDFDVDLPGLWLLMCEGATRDFVPGLYKLKAKHTVTTGGSGKGNATCFFDVLSCLGGEGPPPVY